MAVRYTGNRKAINKLAAMAAILLLEIGGFSHLFSALATTAKLRRGRNNRYI